MGWQGVETKEGDDKNKRWKERLGGNIERLGKWTRG